MSAQTSALRREAAGAGSHEQVVHALLAHLYALDEVRTGEAHARLHGHGRLADDLAARRAAMEAALRREAAGSPEAVGEVLHACAWTHGVAQACEVSGGEATRPEPVVVFFAGGVSAENTHPLTWILHALIPVSESAGGWWGVIPPGVLPLLGGAGLPQRDASAAEDVCLPGEVDPDAGWGASRLGESGPLGTTAFTLWRESLEGAARLNVAEAFTLARDACQHT